MVIQKRHKKKPFHILVLLFGLVACQFFSQTEISPLQTSTPGARTQPSPLPDIPTLVLPTGQTTAKPAVPGVIVSPEEILDSISEERLFAFLSELTSIQPNSGWRSSATEGERQALEFVQATLQSLHFLTSQGMKVEHDPFQVFLTNEIWESKLQIEINGSLFDIPAEAIRGHRDLLDIALRFDSDGQSNDQERDPVNVSGQVITISHRSEINSLASPLNGMIVFADYTLFDSVILGDQAISNAVDILDKNPAGLILVTQFSNQIHASHGTFVGEGGVFARLNPRGRFPILYTRLEDWDRAGISQMDDISLLTSAHLTWDADILSPAQSGNLITYIPGKDSSRALILGAHIDSANNPGAMDDGSGSVVLMEAAAVMNSLEVLPPIDVYLVWFGSEELGLYGSGHFAATHSDLVDKAVAMLQFDCLTRPLDGIEAQLTLATWPFSGSDEQVDLWSDHLKDTLSSFNVALDPFALPAIASDNNSFSGYNLPNAVLIYDDDTAMTAAGGVWYAGHIHDPYDTVEVARDVAPVFVDMAKVALGAIFAADNTTTSYRVTPPANQRAVMIATYTEPIHMTPASLIPFGMQLAGEGIDLDVIPFGQTFDLDDLKSAELVFVLPPIDYLPSTESSQHDEASWSDAEVSTLESYVQQGGLLVLANSRFRMKYANLIYDLNEDWENLDPLAARFGIDFLPGVIKGGPISTTQQHPLMNGVNNLTMIEENGVPFSIETGQTIAAANGEHLVAVVQTGNQGGEVIVLADLGLLGSGQGGSRNQLFWSNLAAYSRRPR